LARNGERIEKRERTKVTRQDVGRETGKAGWGGLKNGDQGKGVKKRVEGKLEEL